MKQTKFFDGTPIDKIGYGTWTIGGRSSKDSSDDERSLKALQSALDVGYRHFDTAEMYASGHSETLLGQTLGSNNISREDLFITSKVHPDNLKYDQVINAFESSLDKLGLDYLDLYLVHWPVENMPLEETFKAFDELVDKKQLRYVGVSNFNIKQLEDAQTYSKNKIATNQVPYSLAHRAYAKNGMVDYCQANDVLLTAFSPVEQGKLEIAKSLQAIADNHKATSYQIALTWLVQQEKVITIPMSFDAVHQAENLAAAEIVLSEDEMALLNNLI